MRPREIHNVSCSIYTIVHGRGENERKREKEKNERDRFRNTLPSTSRFTRREVKTEQQYFEDSSNVT